MDAHTQTPLMYSYPWKGQTIFNTVKYHISVSHYHGNPKSIYIWIYGCLSQFGLQNKLPLIRQFNKRNLHLSETWRLGNQRPSCQQIHYLMGAISWFANGGLHVVSLHMAEREREQANVLLFLHNGTLIPLWGLHSHDLILPKGPPPNITTWDLGFNIWTWGRHNMKPITVVSFSFSYDFILKKRRHFET